MQPTDEFTKPIPSLISQINSFFHHPNPSPSANKMSVRYSVDIAPITNFETTKAVISLAGFNSLNSLNDVNSSVLHAICYKDDVAIDDYRGEYVLFILLAALDDFDVTPHGKSRVFRCPVDIKTCWCTPTVKQFCECGKMYAIFRQVLRELQFELFACDPLNSKDVVMESLEHGIGNWLMSEEIKRVKEAFYFTRNTMIDSPPRPTLDLEPNGKNTIKLLVLLYCYINMPDAPLRRIQFWAKTNKVAFMHYIMLGFLTGLMPRITTLSLRRIDFQQAMAMEFSPYTRVVDAFRSAFDRDSPHSAKNLERVEFIPMKYHAIRPELKRDGLFMATIILSSLRRLTHITVYIEHEFYVDTYMTRIIHNACRESPMGAREVIFCVKSNTPLDAYQHEVSRLSNLIYPYVASVRTLSSLHGTHGYVNDDDDIDEEKKNGNMTTKTTTTMTPDVTMSDTSDAFTRDKTSSLVVRFNPRTVRFSSPLETPIADVMYGEDVTGDVIEIPPSKRTNMLPPPPPAKRAKSDSPPQTPVDNVTTAATILVNMPSPPSPLQNNVIICDITDVAKFSTAVEPETTTTTTTEVIVVEPETTTTTTTTTTEVIVIEPEPTTTTTTTTTTSLSDDMSVLDLIEKAKSEFDEKMAMVRSQLSERSTLEERNRELIKINRELIETNRDMRNKLDDAVANCLAFEKKDADYKTALREMSRCITNITRL